MTDSNQKIPTRDSLRFRLSSSVGISVFITLLISSAILSWITFGKDIESEISRLKGVTTILATSIAKDKAQDNLASVKKGLTSIRNLPFLEYVAVINTDNSAFAEMGISTFLLKPNIDLRRQSPFQLLFQDKIWVEAPIVNGGKNIGHLQILSNITQLKTAFMKNLLINLAAALSTVAVAILFSLRSVKRIIKPVTILSKAMVLAGENGKFSERVNINETGEVGVLASSFNTMLSQIEFRDRQLNDYRENLEIKVETRTRQLKIACDEAETANAAKSDFLATMSHEIRTPMNGMMVMAEMLAAAPLNAKHRRYASVISRSGAGLLSIINDILDFSKIEAGQLKLEETSVDLDNLIADTANLFWDKANKKSLELVTYVAADVPLSIKGDPTRISQIVTNLVNNALKFTSQGGVVIRLSNITNPDQSELNHVRLRFDVTDTGIGIAPEKQKLVFDRFSQADQSTTRNFGGTGLGLAICQKLVDTMGGKIGVTSTPGEGSTFWFEIEMESLEANPVRINADKTLHIVCDRQLMPDALSQMFQEQGLHVINYTKFQQLLWKPGDIILAEPDWIHQNLDSVKNCTIIAISSIGDTLGDQLVRTGSVTDFVYLPALRSEILALCKRIESGKYLGANTLEFSSENSIVFNDFDGIRILAVDDSPVNREVLRDALGLLNVEVTLAESGEQAIEIIQDQTFDMIFMDCSMPGIDGFETTRLIRQHETEREIAATPVIALTAHISSEISDKCLASGMNYYITKPFTIDGLSKQISQYCNSETLVIDQPEIKQASIDVIEPEEDALLNPETLQFIEMLGQKSTTNMAAKIFGLYIEHAPSGLAALEQSVTNNKLNDIAKASHALKSMSLSAGALAVSNQCQIIEDCANDGNSIADDSLAKLTKLVTETLTAMSTHITTNTEQNPVQSQLQSSA